MSKLIRFKKTVYDSDEGYNLYAGNYDEKLEYLNSFEKRKLDDFLKDINGKKILDIGCGTGRIIQDLLDKGADITGVDVSTEMLKIAEKKFPNSNFVEADIRELPFKDNTFDIVICTFVIVHLKQVELEGAFDEVYRILKPGGSFILTNINQKKAPKLKVKNIGEIVIKSYYHMPEHVIEALNNCRFSIETEDFINEGDVWINQIIKGVK